MVRMHLPVRLTAGAAIVCALLAACGSGNDVTAPPPDEPPPVDTPAGGDQPWLTDGEHLGHVRHVDIDAGIIRVDLVDWVNDEAEPNGFRIDNPDPTLWDGRLAADVTASIVDCSAACEPRTVDLAAIASGDERPFNGAYALYDITVRDQQVRIVAERYTP
jgi:hypothetical protein